MAKIIRNALIVLAVLIVCVQAIFPLEKKLRLGKDLAGGVTLTYSVAMAPGEDRKATLERTIEVLKQRIDPSGVMEISIVPQGENRVEITMPLPTDDVKALRKAYEDALSELERNPLSPSRVDEAMNAVGDARASQLKALAAGDTSREKLLNDAAVAFDRAQTLRLELSALTDDAARDAKAAEVAQAEIAYDAARDSVLESAIPVSELRRVFSLSMRRQTLQNSQTGKAESIPSPREQAIERLRTQHPGANAQLDAILAKYNAYESARRTLDDPDELAAMVRGAGVFTFRITVDPGKHRQEDELRRTLRERGPHNSRAEDARWYKVNDISGWYHDVAELEYLRRDPAGFFGARKYVVEEFDGEYFMLCWDTRTTRLTRAEGDWAVTRAAQGIDQRGLPSINFGMDPRGARLLGELTSQHVNEHMAILLDDQVYTAPNLNGTITSSGQIYGDFQQREIDYIVRVLTAGSLSAKLSDRPIGQSIVGPEFGLDNLRNGLYAGALSFAVCAGLLLCYYFSCGAIAVFGLALNVVLIVGVMSLNHAAFSLPGIAGVVLTFAMAVDANVLVYERMREEILRGADLREAVNLGYQRAMPAVIDGNMTNLIVCIVLATLGTPEIKGFGVTMTIGVLTTLFSQLFVTRLVFDVLIDKFRWRKTTMLPLAVPAVQRVFTINVRWMRYRGAFYAAFGVLLAFGIAVIATRGTKMLDTEFVGGTEVVLQLKREGGTTKTLTRAEVADRLMEKAGNANDIVSQSLRSADIVVVDPRADGVTSDRFRIRVGTASHSSVYETDALSSAIASAFQDVIETPQTITYKSASATGDAAPVYPILARTLGESISRPGLALPTKNELGGAAIVLDDITPTVTLDALQERVGEMRGNAAYADVSAHERHVVIIDGTPDAVKSAVIVVTSPNVSYLADSAMWNAQMRDREWALVRETLTEAAPTLTLRSFDSSVASTFAQKAVFSIVISVVLIIIYVWARFGSFRFSAAAIIPTMIDCVIALGLIALAEMVCEANPKIGARIGLLPFKVDLTVVASMLTILGYSINDKIVVLDRIRENRGRMKYVSRQVVEDSINQVMSRTIMTGSTTIISTFLLYIFGGEGVRAFAYSLGLGVIIGTISSIALGAPIVWARRADESAPAAKGVGIVPTGA